MAIKKKEKKEEKAVIDLPFNDNDGILKPKVNAGHFQPKNKVWELAENAGRPKKIASPEILFGHFVDYCEDVDSKPWYKTDFKGKDADKVLIPLQRPYTWQGFDNYLFINKVISDLDDYKQNKDGTYSEFSDVLTRIRSIIYDQKITGATIGVFNAAIISAELGLATKTLIEATITKETKIGFE
jgi:hypothetical protein